MSQESSSIEAVSVKLPAFCTSDPEIWFSIAERAFKAAGTKNSDTKVTNILSIMDQNTMIEIRDIILNMPEENAYDFLKEQVIKRMTKSETLKIKEFLKGEELGDRNPSQFLRHLKSLAGNKVDDQVVRTIWAQGLPKEVQLIIATQKKGELEDLGELADRIHELMGSKDIAAINRKGTSLDTRKEDEISFKYLKEEIEKLKEEIKMLKRRERRERLPTPSRQKEEIICWAHKKYGEKCFEDRCRQPCAYQKNTIGSE